jgi:hypothetical protein
MDILRNALKRIIAAEVEHNILIINLGHYYVQFVHEKGGNTIWCEAISNLCLNKEHYLDNRQKEYLIKLGWNDPDESPPNYTQKCPFLTETDVENLILLILETAVLVYDVEDLTEDDFEFILE